MGAISRHKKRLVGKYFFFKYNSGTSIIGKIKGVVPSRIRPGSPAKKLLVADYSVVWASNKRVWYLSHFSLDSTVDEQCVVFDKMGNMVEFFKLFFDFGGSDV